MRVGKNSNTPSSFHHHQHHSHQQERERERTKTAVAVAAQMPSSSGGRAAADGCPTSASCRAKQPSVPPVIHQAEVAVSAAESLGAAAAAAVSTSTTTTGGGTTSLTSSSDDHHDDRKRSARDVIAVAKSIHAREDHHHTTGNSDSGSRSRSRNKGNNNDNSSTSRGERVTTRRLQPSVSHETSRRTSPSECTSSSGRKRPLSETVAPFSSSSLAAVAAALDPSAAAVSSLHALVPAGPITATDSSSQEQQQEPVKVVACTSDVGSPSGSVVSTTTMPFTSTTVSSSGQKPAGRSTEDSHDTSSRGSRALATRRSPALTNDSTAEGDGCASDEDMNATGSSSSGSGTEGGYAGSASSNDNATPRCRGRRRHGDGTTMMHSSGSSSESSRRRRRHHHRGAGRGDSQRRRKQPTVVSFSGGNTANGNASGPAAHPPRMMISRAQQTTEGMPSSSELDDFGTTSCTGGGTSSGTGTGGDYHRNHKYSSSSRRRKDDDDFLLQDDDSPSILSSCNDSSGSDHDDDDSHHDMDGNHSTAAVAAESTRGGNRQTTSSKWQQHPQRQFPLTHHHGERKRNNFSSGKITTTTTKSTAATPASLSFKTTTTATTGLQLIDGKAPIMAMGCDVMAQVLSFLEPPTSLGVLTMPLSRDWVNRFTRQPELWRVMCLLEPFKANVDMDDSDSSDSSEDSNMSLFGGGGEEDEVFGKYRLLYTAFVRCMRYLSRIKDDAANGRAPTVIDYAEISRYHNVGANQNLQEFLARARGAVVRRSKVSALLSSSDDSNNDSKKAGSGKSRLHDKTDGAAIGVVDDGNDTSIHGTALRKRQSSKEAATTPKKARLSYGPSTITQRLLGPSSSGAPGQTELPWSCAIYSIVNWMVAFSDVEGIQIMCLKVLPLLLEDEQQRIVAQRASLTNAVLRAMVVFPNSSVLHTAAFHTIVLLARPLGGREGMLFHTSMVQSAGIFDSGTEGETNSGKNGIAVMLDSMRRFRSNEVLQSMSCWSLVNVALAPTQKEVLVSLGGIGVTANAMLAHPYSAEVQFRALFALINLVIPAVNFQQDDDEEEPTAGGQAEAGPLQNIHGQHPRQPTKSMEREMLDEMVDQIIRLVVLAMRNFCSSEAVVNRACLVLHNLSLTQDYHETLLWSPNCYQMLEWCIANYRADAVLQKSASGTIQRLQTTLSGNEMLRTRFLASLNSQQQLSLEQAHREAVTLHEQQQRQNDAANNNNNIAAAAANEQQ